jgi:hypothetical protein
VSALDLDKLARLLSMAGSSGYDGEALNAVRLADRLLRAAGATWADLLTAQDQLAVACEAAAVLKAENVALRAELDQLRTTGTAVAVWQDVGAAITSSRTAAAWALDLHDRGDVWLSDFEVDFLNTCTTWTGRLTPRQQSIFTRIMGRITERTGLQPPA